MAPQPGRLYRERLAGRIEEVRPATRSARAFLELLGVDEQTAGQLEIVIAEALNNAVMYSGHSVDLEVTGLNDRVEIRVYDRGPGFDWPEEVRLPEADEDGGRGLFLIATITDHVDFMRGRGLNCLVATKHIDPSQFTAAEAPEDQAVRLKGEIASYESTLDGMTEELSSCYESLAAIYHFSQELGHVVDTVEFAERVLGHLIRISGAEWFVCRLFDAKAKLLETFVVSQGQSKPKPVDLARADDFLEADAVSHRRDQWFGGDRVLPADDPLFDSCKDQSGVVHACFIQDSLVGTIAIGRVGDSHGLTASDISIFHTFADFLMIHITNVRFQEAAVRSRLLESELEIAKKIQLSHYPAQLPEVRGGRTTGWTRSARDVGGDFFDVLEHNGDGLLLVIADVMGKGIPAALYALVLRSALRAVPHLRDQPGALLSHVNEVLYPDLSRSETFITVQLVYVDLLNMGVAVASAGHWPLLAAVPQGAAPDRIDSGGLPIGVMADIRYEAQTFPLVAGHRLALYSDGITEARREDGELFGIDRLAEWLQQGADAGIGADVMRGDLIDTVEAFEGEATHPDDQTLLLFVAPAKIG